MLVYILALWSVLVLHSAFVTKKVDKCHQWHTQEFCSGGGSTNSVEGRRQRERGYGGGSPLVRGFLN